jgi:tRNA U34 5-methylaminomethyl-2-thiouridine-forming methyltransferase MnmC
MRQWPQNIEILTTGDGSPTLAFKRDDGYCEKMHHQGGALSESLFIYGEALTLAQGSGRVHALSFGLGLGYNELITIARLHPHGDDWRIWSYEAVPFLREEFSAWALGEAGTALAEITTQIAAQVGQRLGGVSALELQAWTKAAIQSGRLELRGAFPADVGLANSCNLVYYDAYSNKMDSSLWGEEHFINDLNPVLAPACVFATYAATGALNRALKQLGFRRLDKAGFQGKRQSTLAIREGIR